MKSLTIFFSILFLAVNVLSGCTVALVGGSAVGGYMIGEDDRKAGRIVDDAVITAEVKALFLGDSQIESFKISVDTHQGIVTLAGNVPSKRMINRAIELTRTVEGIEEINSLLLVDGEQAAME
ncbi:MAG: BON domain-containing protein [Methylococcales bacterium]|nr:BON domain-containing protein [Methylococcales bacterium]